MKHKHTSQHETKNVFFYGIDVFHII